MAFEKECDIVLRQLKETMGVYSLEHVNRNLYYHKLQPEPTDLLAIIALLSENDHINVKNRIGVIIENNEVICRGTVMISKKGLAFIANNSYESEKQKSDLLLDITISNGKIQSSLLHINRWIAVASVAVAVGTVLEIVRNYYNYALRPLLISLPIFVSIFLIIILIRKAINSPKKMPTRKE